MGMPSSWVPTVSVLGGFHCTYFLKVPEHSLYSETTNSCDTLYGYPLYGTDMIYCAKNKSDWPYIKYNWNTEELSFNQ